MIMQLRLHFLSVQLANNKIFMFSFPVWFFLNIFLLVFLYSPRLSRMLLDAVSTQPHLSDNLPGLTSFSFSPLSPTAFTLPWSGLVAF